jgi:hypothetical protein
VQAGRCERVVAADDTATKPGAMKIEIRHNFGQVQAQLDRLQKDIGERALASAINKTLEQAKTQMAREITSEFNMKAAYVKERLRIQRASFKQGRFSIEGALIGGNPKRRSANIIAFVENKVSLAEGRRRAKAGTQRQLFVKVKRAGGKKAVKGRYGHGGFIGNKGRTVFERIDSAWDSKIAPVQVIDVGQMFNTRRINNAVRAKLIAKFPEIFAREARFFTDRFNKGRA